MAHNPGVGRVAYDETLAGLVLNHVATFLLGFLRIYERILPEVVQTLTEDLKNELREVDSFLETAIREHIKLRGGENEWHQATRPIWEK